MRRCSDPKVLEEGKSARGGRNRFWGSPCSERNIAQVESRTTTSSKPTDDAAIVWCCMQTANNLLAADT
eukprot:scaffold978_cov134-Skeletonema_marinoi.AAC.8